MPSEGGGQPGREAENPGQRKGKRRGGGREARRPSQLRAPSRRALGLPDRGIPPPSASKPRTCVSFPQKGPNRRRKICGSRGETQGCPLRFPTRRDQTCPCRPALQEAESQTVPSRSGREPSEQSGAPSPQTRSGELNHQKRGVSSGPDGCCQSGQGCPESATSRSSDVGSSTCPWLCPTRPPRSLPQVLSGDNPCSLRDPLPPSQPLQRAPLHHGLTPAPPLHQRRGPGEGGHAAQLPPP